MAAGLRRSRPFPALIVLAAAALSSPAYAQARRAEGDSEMFGQWRFEVKSLTRTAEAVEPVVNTVEACLRPGVEPSGLSVMATPRRGRCALINFLATRSNMMMTVQCDEGDDDAGTFVLSVDPQDGGQYKGELTYGLTLDDSHGGFSTYSEVTAKRIGPCRGTP